MSRKSRRLVVAMAISCTAAISSLIGSPRISFAENVLEFPFRRSSSRPGRRALSCSTPPAPSCAP